MVTFNFSFLIYKSYFASLVTYSRYGIFIYVPLYFYSI